MDILKWNDKVSLHWREFFTSCQEIVNLTLFVFYHVHTYRVSLFGRRPAIVAGRQGAEASNVAGRPMATSIIYTPRSDAFFFSIFYRSNGGK